METVSAGEVEAMETAWVRWNSERGTSTFWHSLESADKTLCGFGIRSDRDAVQVVDAQPLEDVCGFCLRIQRGDDAVFDSALAEGSATNDRKRTNGHYGRYRHQNGQRTRHEVLA